MIVGDITTHTFDFYLHDDATPTATDLPFYGTPTELSYLGFGASNTGSKYDYYDAVHIGAVPIPGAVWLFGSALVALMAVRRRLRKD